MKFMVHRVVSPEKDCKLERVERVEGRGEMLLMKDSQAVRNIESSLLIVFLSDYSLLSSSPSQLVFSPFQELNHFQERYPLYPLLHYLASPFLLSPHLSQLSLTYSLFQDLTRG